MPCLVRCFGQRPDQCTAHLTAPRIGQIGFVIELIQVPGEGETPILGDVSNRGALTVFVDARHRGRMQFRDLGAGDARRDRGEFSGAYGHVGGCRHWSERWGSRSRDRGGRDRTGSLRERSVA